MVCITSVVHLGLIAYSDGADHAFSIPIGTVEMVPEVKSVLKVFPENLFHGCLRHRASLPRLSVADPCRRITEFNV